MKPIYTFCLLVTLIFINCRKPVDKFNERLIGMWINRDSCVDIIEFYPNGKGKYSVIGSSGECNSGVRAEAKARCNKKSFMIGLEKFYFESMPEYIDTTYLHASFLTYDSIPSNEVMVLTKSILNGGRTYKYYKLIR